MGKQAAHFKTESISDIVSTKQQVINDRLFEIMPPCSVWPSHLHAAERHTLLSPGKRLRPLLCLLIAEGGGYSGRSALDLGCVVEMVHAASLILDDLPCMDDAKLRRGQAAAHIAFDESTAILAATSLLNRSYGVVAGLDEISSESRIELVSLLSEAVGSRGLIGGQFADLSNTDRQTTIADVERLNRLKTGALFDFSVTVGLMLGDLPESSTENLNDFSYNLGMAFQLMDDLKDQIMSTPEALKTTGRDQGKATILALTGSKASMKRLETHIQNCKDALEATRLSNVDLLLTLLDHQFAFLYS